MERTSGTGGPHVRDAIRRRAQELYERSGKLPGHDLENWCRAETEIMRNYAKSPRRSAIIVNVDGVQYTGEYDPASSGGYKAGEWKVGDPVPVRLSGNNLYLRRPNGRELVATIVKRSGETSRS